MSGGGGLKRVKVYPAALTAVCSAAAAGVSLATEEKGNRQPNESSGHQRIINWWRRASLRAYSAMVKQAQKNSPLYPMHQTDLFNKIEIRKRESGKHSKRTLNFE